MPVCVMRDGARIAYADEGAGSPLLLVHGWAASGAFFRDVARRFAASHRVITPTLRAHPGSERGAVAPDVAALGDDLCELVEALDLKGVVAIGWSMGAMALWSAAPRLAPRLDGMVVEDMSPKLLCDESWRYGLGGGYASSDIDATLSEIKADWPAYVARFAPRMFAPGARVGRAGQISWAASEMSKADPDAMARLWRSMAEQDYRAALAEIAAPLLVMRGEESQVYPDGATAFVADAAPRGARTIIPGAGHVPHLEAPDIFINQVEAFARSLRRPELRSGGAVP